MWLIAIVPLVLYFFYIPGAVLLSLLKIRDKDNSRYILSAVLGLSLFLIITYLFSYARIINLSLLLFSSFAAWYIFHKQWKQDISNIAVRNNLALILIISLGTLLFISLNITSGVVTESGYHLRGTNARDGVLHLALSKTMSHTFPPQRPGLASVPLQGYHYFYPFLIAKINDLLGIPVEDLLFRIFPTIIAISYGCAFFLLSTHLTPNRSTQNLIVTYAYLGFGTISLLPPLDFPGMQYPLTVVHNPSTLLSITLLLVGWYFWLNINNSYKWILPAALVIGVIAQIKVYAGMIAILSIICHTVFKAAKSILNTKKITLPIPQIIALAVIALITYLTFYIHNGQSASLVWAPLRYIDHFMQQSSFKKMAWDQRKAIFEADNNTLRIMLMYAQAIAIYIIYHLGSRVLIFAKTKSLFKKDFWLDPANILLSSAAIIMIALPLLTIQSVAVFDIGQFLWIASALSAIPAGFGAGYLWKYKTGKLLVSLIIIIPFALGYASDFQKYFLKPPSLQISPENMKIYNYISQNTAPSEVLLYIPYNSTNQKLEFEDIPIISAVTGRLVYYEKEVTPFKHSGLEQDRVGVVKEAAKWIQECNTQMLNQTLTTIDTTNIVYTHIPCETILQLSSDSKISPSLSYFRFILSKD